MSETAFPPPPNPFDLAQYEEEADAFRSDVVRLFGAYDALGGKACWLYYQFRPDSAFNGEEHPPVLKRVAVLLKQAAKPDRPPSVRILSTEEYEHRNKSLWLAEDSMLSSENTARYRHILVRDEDKDADWRTKIPVFRYRNDKFTLEPYAEAPTHKVRRPRSLTPLSSDTCIKDQVYALGICRRAFTEITDQFAIATSSVS